jgi:hypothetical protein
MTSKERVLCAVAHGEPDRTPIDIHPNPFVAERLQREWGISDYREMLRRLGSDIVDLRSTVNPHYRGPVPLLQTHPDGTRENFWGWRTKIMETACGPEEIHWFIACGADILDPLQACAQGMDPQTLKDRFGTRICLHGGIDTQHLLPNGTPEQVAAETRRVTEILTRGGGAIIAPCHVVQMDVSTANLEAMRDAGWQHEA